MWFKNEGIFYFLIFGTLLIILSNSSITPKLMLLFISDSINNLSTKIFARKHYRRLME